LGGNKLRKLEFLLADAVRGGCDSVVTIGGLQSNHCRATAAAARMVGMEPHLILRTPAAAASTTARSTPAGAVPGAGAAAASSPVASSARDAGTVGNLLVDRAVGASLYTCTPGEYGRVGSDALVSRLCHRLGASGNRRPYPIPVGGSSGLGSWGYVQAVDELVRQLRQAGEEASVDHVVFASGSGGTAAGIAIGLALAYDGLPSSDGYSKRKRPQVHAVGVCDAPITFTARWPRLRRRWASSFLRAAGWTTTPAST
jgi:1-aminocyclopropane-1-carboxylate deaminase/D-cysteine desulfhydrase-like pyridoxal-dependent ACC family enzyme